MTIAVTAPTGNVGSRVVQLLIQAGVRPRVLVRDPARLGPVLPLVDVRRGDLLDGAFVTAALDGVTDLLWVSPESFTAPDPLADMVTMADQAAAAVRAAGVRRVVLISSVGAERGTGAGLIDGLAHAERALTATGAELVVLRCGYYFTNLFGMLDDLRSGTLPTTASLTTPMPWVDPRDVGEVAAARLLAAAYAGPQAVPAAAAAAAPAAAAAVPASSPTSAASPSVPASPAVPTFPAVPAAPPSGAATTVGVHGPEDLSWVQVAACLSEVLGRAIEPVSRTDDELIAGLCAAGLSEAAAAGIAGMTSGLRDGFHPEQPRDLRTTTPTTLRAWATATLRPALDATGQQ